MALFRRRPSREQIRADAKRDAIKHSITALAKAVSAGAPVMPGSQFQGGWNNLGNSSMAMAQRVTANMAQTFNVPQAEIEQELADQGLSWGPPFPPGRPLDPFFGVRRPPRTWDFSVGENVQLTPRHNRISFQTLESIYNAYDIAQICCRHLVNDVRSLDYAWQPIPNVKDDVSDDLNRAREFFDFPDRRQPFRAWIAEYLQDVLRFDAGALYVRRSEDNTPIALEVVSGKTIVPLIDFYGRVAADEDDQDPPPDGMIWEGGSTPAFLQIVEGLPWVWLTADDLIYQPLNPLPESQYGQAPLEAVIMTANTDLRFQFHFLTYFTAGSLPAGFMEAPPDMSDPTQITEFQEVWDAMMLGDQEKLRQIRWVPAGAKFTPAKPLAEKFDSDFPLYLMRRTAAAFGVTPADLGFTEDVNRATGDTQVDIQFRVGTTPLLRHVEDVVNLFVAKELKLRVRLAFDRGQETEDRVATAQAEKIYIEAGVISPDEPRKKLGYEVDKMRPVPRFIQNSRVGPVPLLALQSLSGKVDPDTYSPDATQPLVSNPYIGTAGIVPAAGTPEQKAMGVASSQLQRDMLRDTTGEPPTAAMQAIVAQAGAPAGQNPALAAQPASVPPGQAAGATPEPAQAQSASKEATAGVTAETGVQGVDLVPGDDDDDELEDDAAKAAAVAVELRRWRDNTRQRLRKGRAPRQFHSELLSDELLASVWKELQAAGSVRGEVDRVFATAMSGPLAWARKGRVVSAGIVVQAVDTGRVLLVQRQPDATDPNGGAWEWPGGHLDVGESAWDGALREWEEETGATLNEDAEHAGRFVSPDGTYQAFVVRVPAEGGLEIFPQLAEVSRVAWWDPACLDDDRVAVAVRAELPALEPLLKHSPTSGMVSLDLEPGTLPTPADGIEDQHITIVFLGRDVTDDLLAEACGRAETVAASMPPPTGIVGGLGTFPPSESSDGKVPVFAVPDVPAAIELRAAFEDLSASEHTDFKPHVTLAYVDEGDVLPDPVPDTPVSFAFLSVHRGDSVWRFPFGQATKAAAPRAAAAFHRHTDRLVEHYSPQITEALQALVPASAIRTAITEARKVPVEPDRVAVEKASPAELAQAAVRALQTGLGTASKLKGVLTGLWGDAGLQGAHNAARAVTTAGPAEGIMLRSLQTVASGLPDDYWDVWRPGWGEAAARAADGGLARLLDAADVEIKGITGTTLDRLGDTIAEGIARGDSVDTIGAACETYIADPARAVTVANTESARSMNATSMDTYRRNGVEKKAWEAEDDCCDLCQANVDAGEIGIDDEWPSDDLPCHPACRCAVLPVIDTGES